MAQEKKFVSTIPLSMRGKKRYILFQVSVEGIPKIPKGEFEKTLNQHLVQCFGTLGLPEHRVKLIVFDEKGGLGILRCAHTSKDSIISALILFSSFQGKKAVLRTRLTSGSLKKLKPVFQGMAG